MLSASPYVRVFALDVSKVFDTVRHKTVMEKVAEPHMPDQIYNWIVDFLCNHSHCTRYTNVNSLVATVTDGIIQGSGLEPAAFLVNAVDLRTVQADNDIIKFADDTYLIVPAVNSSYCCDELSNIQSWATANNLILNCQKSKEIIFRARGVRGKSVQLATPCPSGVYREN